MAIIFANRSFAYGVQIFRFVRVKSKDLDSVCYCIRSRAHRRQAISSGQSNNATAKR